MFQNLRQGNTLYILEKSETPILKLGEVINVGTPTPVYNTQTAGLTMGFQPKMEVLVRAKVDDKEGDFAHLPTDQSVHDYGTMIVTDSREAMLSEVDSMKQRSQHILDTVDYHKEVVDACDGMFKTLNPNYAKERERDEAIDTLNERMSGIEEELSKVVKLLTKK